MKSFKQILQDKPIYPFDASPQVSQNLEKHCCDAVAEFIKQAVEGTTFDSMEETVYVTAFVGKLEKLIGMA